MEIYLFVRQSELEIIVPWVFLQVLHCFTLFYNIRNFNRTADFVLLIFNCLSCDTFIRSLELCFKALFSVCFTVYRTLELFRHYALWLGWNSSWYNARWQLLIGHLPRLLALCMCLYEHNTLVFVTFRSPARIIRLHNNNNNYYYYYYRLVGLVISMSWLLIMRSRVLSPALPQILNVD